MKQITESQLKDKVARLREKLAEATGDQNFQNTREFPTGEPLNRNKAKSGSGYKPYVEPSAPTAQIAAQPSAPQSAPVDNSSWAQQLGAGFRHGAQNIVNTGKDFVAGLTGETPQHWSDNQAAGQAAASTVQQTSPDKAATAPIVTEPTGKAPAGKTPTGKAPAGKTPTDKAPAGKTTGSNPKVAAFQQQLNSMGANLTVDGVWGQKTQAAYEHFYNNHAAADQQYAASNQKAADDYVAQMTKLGNDPATISQKVHQVFPDATVNLPAGQTVSTAPVAANSIPQVANQTASAITPAFQSQVQESVTMRQEPILARIIELARK